MPNEKDPCAIWHMDTLTMSSNLQRLSKPQLIEIVTLISDFNKTCYDARITLSEAIEEIIKNPQDPSEE